MDENRAAYRTYDSNLKNMLAVGRHSGLVRELKIPKSTLSYWRRKGHVEIIGGDSTLEFVNLKADILDLKRLIENQKIMIDILKEIGEFAKIPVTLNRLSRKEKERLVEVLERNSEKLPISESLSLLGILKSSYYRWKINIKCERKEQEICPRVNSRKLTHSEINIMKEFVESSEYSHFSLTSLCMFAQRKGFLYSAPATWQRYSRVLKWGRKRSRIYPKTNRIGVRAKAPNEIWHIDVTRMKLPNNEKYYIQTIIDNYSRYVVAWNVSDKMTGIKTSGLIQEALKVVSQDSTIKVPNLFVDGGFENINEHVERLINEGAIERTIAQVDVSFSNSMVEALFKSLKNNYLYQKRINTMTELTGHVRFYFQQHNEEIPHVSLSGATPKEVYEGKCVKNLFVEIKKSMEQVRLERVKTNRKANCGTCIDSNGS